MDASFSLQHGTWDFLSTQRSWSRRQAYSATGAARAFGGQGRQPQGTLALPEGVYADDGKTLELTCWEPAQQLDRIRWRMEGYLNPDRAYA